MTDEKTGEKKLLILDLDETLIYSRPHTLAGTPDFQVGPYHVYKRPGLDQFLAACSDWFQVAVWTSASADYAAEVIHELFPSPERLAFIWTADHCTVRYDQEVGEHCARKNLKKIKRRGYALESVIVVDDSPEKWRQSYGNLVSVHPFLGDEGDDELTRLLPYLRHLKDQPNIRALEKRSWRSHAPTSGAGISLPVRKLTLAPGGSKS